MEKAIKYFEDMEKKQTDWYMKHDKVSFAMMVEYDNFLRKVKWAIKTLKEKELEENVT